MKKVVERVQRKPTRSTGLVKWIRAVLTQHTALLMSQPELVRSLTPLYQLVEVSLHPRRVVYMWMYVVSVCLCVCARVCVCVHKHTYSHECMCVTVCAGAGADLPQAAQA